MSETPTTKPENLLCEGRVHFLAYALPFLTAAVFLLFYFLFHFYFPVPENRAFLAAALICLVYGVLKKASLRAALTDRRVIIRSGVLLRYETDMDLSRIESIAVTQTFAERLTEGATILLRGIGGTVLVLPVLKNYKEFCDVCENACRERLQK